MFLEVYFLAWFIPYVLIALWLTRLVIKDQDTKKGKWIGGGITGGIFFLILFGDSLVGHMYLNYLCTTHGGPHVYQIVELGPEYWNEDGSAKFIYPNGTIVNDKFVGGRFNEMFSNKFRTNRVKHELLRYKIQQYGREVRNSDDQILAIYRSYLYKGGWLINSIGYETTATNCGKRNKNYLRDFYKTIFLNKNN
jgi:hypothetical protein